MANQEQLAILERSVSEWNAWRKKNPGAKVDLSDTYLGGAPLFGGDLSGVILNGAGLGAATLTSANLRGAKLRGTDLHNADLSMTDLSEADLSGAFLRHADLTDADFTRADLTRADLFYARLHTAYLEGANFTGTYLNSTIFAGIDLSAVKGLEKVIHGGPSTIGIDTLYASKGEIPETFLRGCGVPDTLITFSKSLVGKAIEYYSCFISYSSQDEDFAKRLYADLQSYGVRCWFAPEDLKIGDKFRTRIDEAIRVHDRLLLVLSKDSINSAWVEKEVETAFERERRDKRTILFPVRLDKTIMETEQAWAADIRRTRHIGDFTCWKQHDGYKQAFDRLMRDLKQ